MNPESLPRGVATDLRIKAIQDTVAADPEIIAFCLDHGANPIDPPTEVHHLVPEWSPGSPVDELFGDNAASAISTWHAAMQTDGDTRLIALAAEPDVTRRLRLVNLIEEHGCMVVLIGSQGIEQGQFEGDEEKLVARIGRMKVSQTSVVLDADEGATQLLGFTVEELVGHNTTGYIHPDDIDAAVTAWLEMLGSDGAASRLLLRYQRKDGEWIWAEVTHRNLLASHGYVEREFIDVSARISAIVDAENKGRILNGIADVLPSGIAHFGADHQLQFANDRWREITGIPGAEDLTTYARLLLADDRGEVMRLAKAEGMDGDGVDFELTVVPADGSAHRRCRTTLRPLISRTGENEGVVISVDDITESWHLQQRLVEQATSDNLTGLANRWAIIDHLDTELAGKIGTDQVTAVVFIDLNGFKKINDVLGHGVGDGLIRQIGESLKTVVRSSDVAARHGGDEFLIVLSSLPNTSMVMQLARRLLDAATGRFYVDGHSIDSSASCGVAIDIGGRHSAERLIAQADIAMYEQKRSGGQDPAVFESMMFEDQRHELTRDTALRHASTDGSLVLHYQPIVELGGSNVVGYEALLRWMFEGELTPPDSFIGLAERRGLINEIGNWVLDQVVADAAKDPRRDLLWTLNVSPVQLRDGSFDMAVASALTKYGLDPAQLGLELTEGVLVARSDLTNQSLLRLADMGVSLLVDDFGTGYASLDYLRTLPVHGLKVDRCFTADLDKPRTNAIVGNVVSLAASLGLRLVVEGVETADQHDALVDLGVTVAQGFLFGRPKPLQEQVTAEAQTASSTGSR